MLDLLIIGGGPIGIATALEAKKKRLSYRVIEKGPLVNSIYNYPNNMQFFSSSEKLEIDNIPFISKNAKPMKAEALEYYRRIAASNQLVINLFEEVKEVGKQEDNFIVSTTHGEYRSKNIVVATGFYDIPHLLDVPGESLPKVFHYYKDPHYFYGQKVVIVGASNSAIDAALEIFRKGGEVTLVIRGSAIGERVKYWVKPDVENRIKEGNIKTYFNTEVVEIQEKLVFIRQKDEKEEALENDFVLAMTGYRPNFKFLEKFGIQIDKHNKYLPKYNPQTMESNQKGIYLAGVICGGKETHKWFIENSRIHANKIVEDISMKFNRD